MNARDNHLIRFLIVSLCYFDFPIQPAHAELVSAHSVNAAIRAESARQKLDRYLEREDVRAGLEQSGVEPAAARARVDALSDAEVTAIAGKMESLPAGGKHIGTLVFAFALLLVTDILGFTKVYSFIRSAKT